MAWTFMGTTARRLVCPPLSSNCALVGTGSRAGTLQTRHETVEHQVPVVPCEQLLRPHRDLLTPGSNQGKINGRDHNHHGFTTWLAGGGVKGGAVYDATDEFGFKAKVNPVHVDDLQATILHLLGFDHERLTFRHAGRDFRLTDVHGSVVKGALA